MKVFKFDKLKKKIDRLKNLIKVFKLNNLYNNNLNLIDDYKFNHYLLMKSNKRLNLYIFKNRIHSFTKVH